MPWNIIKKSYQEKAAFAYAFFLVFITPLSIPFAIYSLWQGKVGGLEWALFGVLYSLSLLGITLGYHRLVTHRGFTTYRWIKRALLVCGAMAWQGPPAAWASLHIQHHANSDREGDPHSPVAQSFWYSHCGWIFNKYRPNYRCYGKWLLRDKDVAWISRYYALISIGSFMLPLALGLQAWLWASWVRLCVASHATWSVNSVCHFIGSRPYNKIRDNSRNNSIVAFLTFGEGWHNHHHQALRNPKFLRKWYQIDVGYWLLIQLKYLGLAWDLRTN